MKTIKYLLSILLVCWGSSLLAQSPNQNFGFTSDSQKVKLPDNTIIKTSSGSVGANTTVFHSDAGINFTSGFAYPALYFPQYFEQDLFVSKGYFSDYVEIKWELRVNTDRITRFRIFRKPFGSSNDSTQIASVSSDERIYRDEFAEKGVLYKYTIYAEGISDDIRVPLVNLHEGVGFALATGTTTGRITYEGGNAVKGVTVLAETDDDIGGHSVGLLGMAGDYMSVPHKQGDDGLELNTGFTLQLWFSGNDAVIFSKGQDYELKRQFNVDKYELVFKVGDATVTLDHQVDGFSHIAASYDPTDGLSLYSFKEDQNGEDSLIFAHTAAPSTGISDNTDNLFFGRSFLGNDDTFGNWDEIRLWNTAIDTNVIKNNYDRFISGSEEGLMAYWRLDVGVGEEFYDLSKSGFDFHERHGVLVGANWEDITPPPSKLGFKGLTDEDGNYTIAGFPYKSGGSLYKFTPIFGVHEFDPAQQKHFVGDGSNILNNINFTDISAFKVTGSVRYTNTPDFGVEGYRILIDGQPAIDGDGNLILTNNFGQFEVDVPIGEHTLKLVKHDHVLIDTDANPHPYEHNFQQPISGLEFFDKTLVKLAGRVVGGPVEAEKLLGFGLSKNNIGNATIILSPQKTFDITTEDRTLHNQDGAVTSTQVYEELSPRQVTIHANDTTGEYLAYLLPEKYIVTSVQAGDYNPTDAIVVDLSNTIDNDEVLEDTVGVMVDGTLLTDPPFNPSDTVGHDDIRYPVLGDTTWIVAVDSFTFRKRQDFIYRVTPTIEITNEEGGALFGETEVEITKQLDGSKETVAIISNGNYNFGHPAFIQLGEYTIKAKLAEEYTHPITGVIDKVPVKDGKLEIRNELAAKPALKTIELDKHGEATYTFMAGFPEITQNPDPNNSYTRTINITAVSGNQGSIRTIWNENDPLRGFVLGGKPIGNNFTTTGPKDIFTILRDPSGSNSTAYLEMGSEISRSKSINVTGTIDRSGSVTASLGADVVTFAGLGGGVIIATDVSADATIGTQVTSTLSKNNESVETITNTQRWSTSDSEEPNFVGASGDVFVGSAYNIIYGVNENVKLIPTAECRPENGCQQAFGGYSIGVKKALRITPKIETSFIFTQHHIETNVIPGLETLRNSIIKDLGDGADVDGVAATDKVQYISYVRASDEKFGTDNSDRSVWGSQAHTTGPKDWGTGPSYRMIRPNNIPTDSVLVDSVHFYNREIKQWKKALEDNERNKVQATLEENISFDAGATFDKSVTTERSETKSTEFEMFIGGTVAGQLGLSVGGVGVSTTIETSIGATTTTNTGTTTTTTTTYGYTLADGVGAPTSGQSVADYYTIDVKRPKDGFGPVFMALGGVSSCPYEGEVLTSYFEPGQHSLTNAMIPAEAPAIEVTNPVVSDVPANREATFTLLLKNESTLPGDNMYNLRVDDATNPNGAVLRIDGQPLTSGRTFFIPSGASVQKTLKISIGREDSLSYENISLIFESVCDPNIGDDATVSVFFLPACSDVRMSLPKDNFVLNTNTRPKDTLSVNIDSYDLSFSNFQRLAFQYKPAGSIQWVSDMVFYNRNFVDQATFDAASDPKAWIQDVQNAGTIPYQFDMHSLPDRVYNIRAETICELTPGVEVKTPTDELTGTKDTKRPKLFGSPQPADGILTTSDEISIRFDEPIAAGLLTPFNFSMQGVLNNYELRHNVSLNLDGSTDYVSIPAGLHLENHSFTVEMWVKRNTTSSRQVMFAKGNHANDRIDFGFDPSDHFYVVLGATTYTAQATNTETGWMHIALTYDHANKELSVYKDSENGNIAFFDDEPVTSDFKGEGPLNIGRELITATYNLNGNIHDLRIWSKARSHGDIFATMLNSLSGSEIGLIGYWPFDEAHGNIARDKARFRTATLFTDWIVLPQGSAFKFDGSDDYLEINTANTVAISDETNFSIEFWFKGATQSNTTLFSSGKGDGTDALNEGSWSVGFNGSSKLTVFTDGQTITLEEDEDAFLDDNWYHFAMSVNRLSGVNIFIDGELRKSESVQDLPPLFGANMWLGARGFKTGATTTSHDQFFNGIMDEFRMWELAKKQVQVNLTRNAKLEGDEAGLIAYYPFEDFKLVAGVPQKETTLTDQWKNSRGNPAGVNGGTAVASGGASFTNQTPNVIDSRPVTKVDFDFAVNVDEIILTPSPDQAAAIEKSLLEISVERVEDLFENRIGSPISWTAFVDRNQVVWDMDVVNYEKEVNTDFQFTTVIVNRGGTKENFSIENLPPWLHASPQSGAIDPESTLTITFTVNEGLNTGNYQEDIFLSTDFGFDEKMQLNLRVYKPLPANWTVNPDDFEFSMNIIAQIRIGGRLSHDEHDVVAVFINDETRGIGNLEYVPAYDNYQVFMTVYGNTADLDSQLSIKVWDDSEGLIYTDISPTYTFETNASHGVPSNPVILETGQTVETDIDVPAGWKWLSFNLSSNNLSDVNKTLANLNPANGDLIKSKTEFDHYSAADNKWLGSISSKGGFSVAKLYRLRLSNIGTVSYSGIPVNPENTSITIKQGWNEIGFLPNQNIEINEALAGFNATSGDLIKSQYLLAIYDENHGWIGNLDFLEPTQGYMLKAQREDVFFYPKLSAINGRTDHEENDISHFDLGAVRVNPHQYRYQMTLVGQLTNYPHTSTEPRTRLLALVNDEVMGIAKPEFNPITGHYDYFMVMYSNTEHTLVEFVLADEFGNKLSGVHEQVDFGDNVIKGNLKEPIDLTLKQEVILENGLSVFPNPFNESTTLRFKLLENAEVTIDIVDVTGKKVTNITTEMLSAGFHELKWDAKDSEGLQVKSGVYLVRARINGEFFVHRLVLLR